MGRGKDEWDDGWDGENEKGTRSRDTPVKESRKDGVQYNLLGFTVPRRSGG